MTFQDKAQSEQVELVLSESQRQAFQAMAVANGMSPDVKVFQGEVSNFTKGDTA